MRKIIATILIVLGLLAVTLSIREYRGKKKEINLLGYEFSLRNKKAKKIFYKNTGIGALMIVGGVGLIAFGTGKKRIASETTVKTGQKTE